VVCTVYVMQAEAILGNQLGVAQLTLYVRVQHKDTDIGKAQNIATPVSIHM
jgi:hypothetical protein